MTLRVAVIGATGKVGREMIDILDERNVPLQSLRAVATPASRGSEISYGDRMLRAETVDDVDWGGVDLCLMAAGGDTARALAPDISAAGCVVIDNSSAFRMDPGVPLVVPEVNADALEGFGRGGIIANPNCSTAQLVVALAPLHRAATISRVVVATYQSTSGAGKQAMDELWTQTRGIFVNQPAEPGRFTKQIAFNVIPHIDSFMEDGQTREEWKMREETRKILDPDIELIATCVRVASFVGHGEAVHVETRTPLSAGEASELLSVAPGVEIVDRREDGGYVTPVECVGEWAVFVSRLRDDPSVENGLAFWCVADNLRKGAALNAIQIAENLIEREVW